MAVDFVKIHNKLSRAVAKNFPLRIETDVVVENINLEQHYFTIKTTAGLIDCHTSQTDLSNIKNGTNIHIEGYLKIHTTTISKIYLELENYFILGKKKGSWVCINDSKKFKMNYQRTNINTLSHHSRYKNLPTSFIMWYSSFHRETKLHWRNLKLFSKINAKANFSSTI